MFHEQSGAIDISEIKRCYADIVIEINCPYCDTKMQRDLNDQYISYPKIGKEDSLYFCCDGCDKEYELPINIVDAKLTIEFDRDPEIIKDSEI
jgi:hypothetical protein